MGFAEAISLSDRFGQSAAMSNPAVCIEKAAHEAVNARLGRAR